MSKPVAAPAKSSSLRTGGLFWSLLLLAAGAVGIREALVAGNTVSGSPWLSGAIESVDGLSKGGWVLPSAIAAGVLGLLFVALGLKTRPRPGWKVQADAPVYILPKAVSGLVLASVKRVSGVMSVSTKTTSKKVDVLAKTTGADAELREGVRQAAEETTANIERRPKVKVRLRRKADA